MELEQIASIIGGKCDGQESQQELEALIQEAYDRFPALPKYSVEDLVAAIQGLVPTSIEYPQLLIDWKTLPSIGTQCTPQFLLVVPEEYIGLTPQISHSFKPRLDCEVDSLTPKLKKTPEGHWEWYLPFALTQGEMNCRPGDYILTIQAKFLGSGNAKIPRRLRKTIRLIVPDPDQSDGQQVLEIDADGKSIVNLQGMDLARFGTVKLKGSDAAIINALNTANDDETEVPENEHTGSEVHQFTLEPDSDYEFDSFRLAPGFTSGSRVRDAALKLSDKHIILYTQHQLRLGRSRDADLVTRFLPRSQENDQSSRNLSRVHVVFEFAEDGLHIRNHSSSGFEYNLRQHEQAQEALLPKELVNEPHEIGLGKFLGTQLRLNLVPLGSDGVLPETEQFRERVNDFAENNHLRKSPLWRISARTQWDCLKIERLNNLLEEEYVVICQTAFIGSSHKFCGVSIPGLPSIAANLIYLDNMFFIGPAHASVQLAVNDTVLEHNELAALTVDDTIKIDDVEFAFNAYQQLHV